ncbi:MAG: hypothetical protein ABS948_13820 [Solibacillus sp.]
MRRKWALGLTLAVTMVLGACGQTIEEQATAGMSAAETTFEAQANDANTTFGQIKLYMPNGFTIEQGIDQANYTLINKENMYILFVNVHEPTDSQLLYDILKEDASKEIIGEDTFETDGVFGFSAITKASDETSELIVSVGGVKLTTISKNKNLDNKLAEMMQIVQSVRIVEQAK